MTMKGETLVEVLIALTTAVIVVSAVTVLGVSSLNNAQFIKDQDQATIYAQEGMELARRIRNSNYTGYRSYNGLYCVAKGQTTLGSIRASCSTRNIDNRYIRSIQVQQNAGCGVNLANTTVTVSWTDGKCTGGTYCHSSRLSSCLSTVSPVVAP